MVRYSRRSSEKCTMELFLEGTGMKLILTIALCSAALIGDISTASAQYYGRGYGRGYYEGPPATAPTAPPEYYANRDYQPMGYGEAYAPIYLPNGRPSCAHRNYRPIRGWCQRAW
jgi:hypothetical protein